MRSFLLILLITLFGCLAADTINAQAKAKPAKTPAAPAPPGTVQAEKTSAVIEREKFDPTRDPAADLKLAVEKLRQKENG